MIDNWTKSSPLGLIVLGLRVAVKPATSHMISHVSGNVGEQHSSAYGHNCTGNSVESNVKERHMYSPCCAPRAVAGYGHNKALKS